MSTKTVRWAFNFTKWQPTYNELLLATSCLELEEKQRLAKFVFKNDFKSSLIGRLMLRKFVTLTTNLQYNQIKFKRNDKGKPILDDLNQQLIKNKQINFNVSHQGDYTVLVGTCNDDNNQQQEQEQLGVDVMKIEFLQRNKSLDDYFRTMSKIFSHNEWNLIKNVSNDDYDKLKMFCRFWCLKESYLKATGVGITIDLRDICFNIKTINLNNDSVINDTEIVVNGVQLTNWQFHEMLLNDNHCIAIAFNNKRYNNELDRFDEIDDFNELLVDSIPILDKDDDYCRDYFNKLDKN